jgi:3-oxoacyl-[acyl-carrier protein] reductase
MGSLKEKIAVVTGSSRGIGAAIAREFAREGAAVAVHGRDRGALSAVSSEIQDTGGTVMEVVAELTSFDEIEAARRAIERELGPVDVLVANAGGSATPPGPLEEIEEEAWRASVDSNLTATFLTVKSFLPGMKERSRGSIVTMSSAAARRAHPMNPLPYSAAKAGIEVLTHSLATQVAPFNVRVNCVAPETIMTERNEGLIPQEHRQALIDSHPIRRLGTPQDVAEAVRFLADDSSSGWITGVVLDVAGGAVIVR